MARSPQLLGDGTFRITPSLWLQVFIISAQIFGSVFVPVCFCLLSDKKRETYDLMFSMLIGDWIYRLKTLWILKWSSPRSQRSERQRRASK